MASHEVVPTAPAFDRLALAEELLDRALTAQRQGGFDALVRRHPRAARWLMRRHLPVVLATTVEAAATADLAATAGLLLKWGLSRLRPDRAPRLDGIDKAAWIEQPAWRPLLALMCQARLCTVPAFPDHYRRRPGESAADNLCGLWGIGPSSFYRSVERAKQMLARLVFVPADAADRLALRQFVAETWAPHAAERRAWHQRLAGLALQAGQASAALWHAVQVDDAGMALEVLRTASPALAGDAETDTLLDRLEPRLASAAQRVELVLGRAALARMRQEPEREQRQLELALQAAREGADPLLLGIVYGVLGRFHEQRDSDRAFAAYEDSLKYLHTLDANTAEPRLRSAYLTSLVRLAWMHVVRDHPQARSMLEQAEAIRHANGLPDDLVGLLEQTWGEYWRRAGDHARAIQARHRALNAFERVNDRRSVLVTYLNLVLLHGDVLDEEKAADYAQRVFTAAQSTVVEPSILVATHGNLGFAHAKVNHYELAIKSFRQALALALPADLRLHANRLRLNLASAHYGLYVQTRDPVQERLGDEALAAFMQAPPSETTPSFVETAKGLKAEVLGEMPDRSIDGLLDDEAAAHQAEMAEIGRRRAALGRGPSPAQAVLDRVEIIAAYLRIAARERDAAAHWAAAHGAAAELRRELRRFGAGVLAAQDPAEGLSAAWRGLAGDLLDDARRLALAARLLRDGELSKASYGQAASVSPATASKHLATLTERGLLVQTGRGPATRYRLPQAD